MLKNTFNYLDKKTKRLIFLYQIPSFFQGLLESVGVFSILPLMIVLIESSKETLLIKFNFLKPFLLDYTFREIQIIAVLFFIIFIIVLNIFISLNFIFSEKLVKKIYTSYFSKMLNQYLIYSNKNQFKPSEAINNLSYNLHHASIHIFRNIVRSIPKLYTLVLIFIIMIYIDFEKTLSFVIFFAVIYTLIIKKVSKSLKFFGKDSSNQNENIIKSVKEVFENIQIVYIDKLKSFFDSKLNSFSQDHARSQNQLQIYTFVIKLLVETIAILSICILILYTVLFDELKLMIPLVSFYLYAFYRSFPAMQTIFTTYTMIKAWKHTLFDITKNLNTKKIQTLIDEKEIQFLNEIEFKNISFKYENKKDFILKDLNIKIKKSKFLGIKGSSGSGKTTFLNILSGLEKPTHGEFTIDGKKINELNINSWFKLISYVPQRIFLLNTSIDENIVLNREIKDEELKKIINTSSLEKFIENKEFNYKEVIEENTTNISGGQIQRIGIARALVKKPQILILDETTSGMQLNMEKEIILNIKKNYPDITIILVTHRDESLKICDEVLKLSDK